MADPGFSSRQLIILAFSPKNAWKWKKRETGGVLSPHHIRLLLFMVSQWRIQEPFPHVPIFSRFHEVSQKVGKTWSRSPSRNSTAKNKMMDRVENGTAVWTPGKISVCNFILHIYSTSSHPYQIGTPILGSAPFTESPRGTLYLPLCQSALARDARLLPLPPPIRGAQILSISCNFGGNLAKYVVPPPRGLAPRPR